MMFTPLQLTTDKVFLTFVLNFFAYATSLGLLFTTLILCKTRTFRSLKLLGTLSLTSFTRFTVLISLLSLSGIPPLFGFFAKLFIFFALIIKGNYALLFAFLFFNLFALYFYLQTTRHLAQGGVQKSAKVVLFRTTVAYGSASF